MALNIDATFGGKLNCAFKNDMRNLASIFSAKHVWKSKNWHFDEILLSKVENVWASNLQGSFVSWKWRICRSKNYRSRSKKYAWSKNYIRSENYICKLKNHFPIEELSTERKIIPLADWRMICRSKNYLQIDKTICSLNNFLQIKFQSVDSSSIWR